MNQAVCVLIEDGSGNVLCVSRGDDLENWGLPGGKVEPGESLSQAAIRELSEETGLFVDVYELSPPIFKAECHGKVDYETSTYRIDPGFKVLAFNFISSSEGAVEWRPWEDLTSYKSSFKDYNLALLRKLADEPNA